jgi:RNA polymerase sigma-70 factor (ECF subfamily)
VASEVQAHERNSPDAPLISLAAAGDLEAFRRLVARHTPAVLRTASRYTGNRFDAEDICQEVFLQVWRKAESFQGRSGFSTWLYRIVVNRCLNHRKKKRREPLFLEALPEALRYSSRIEDPATTEEREEARREVGEAVRSLPGRQRAALILTQLEGLSYRETAEVLGATVPAVESLVFRGRALLRRRLAGLLSGQGQGPDRVSPNRPTRPAKTVSAAQVFFSSVV